MTKRSLIGGARRARSPGRSASRRRAHVRRSARARAAAASSSSRERARRAAARGQGRTRARGDPRVLRDHRRMFEWLVTEVQFVGRTERDVAWDIQRLFHEEGAEALSFESIVGSGVDRRASARARGREGDRGGRARRHRHRLQRRRLRLRLHADVCDRRRSTEAGGIRGRARGAAGGARRDPRRRHRRGRRRRLARLIEASDFNGKFGHGLGHGARPRRPRGAAPLDRERRHARRATSSRSSRASTSRAGSASGSRTTSSSPRTASRTRCGSRRNSSPSHDARLLMCRRRSRRSPAWPRGRAHQRRQARHPRRPGAAANLGGQAYWSFGGLFLVDSPEQRRLGIKDSLELAWQDWLGSAGSTGSTTRTWARQWAEAYVEFAAGEKRAWLHEKGSRFLPTVGWAERGGCRADGHGNSVPALPHHLGHRHRASSSRSCDARTRRSTRGLRDVLATATGSTSWSSPTAP